MPHPDTPAVVPSESADAAASSVARVRAVAQAAQLECDELRHLDELLKALVAGAESVTLASRVTQSVGVAPVAGVNAPQSSADTSISESDTAASWESECRLWRAGLEAGHLLHASGLSTTFAALEHRVSDAATLTLSSKLHRVHAKSEKLRGLVHDRAQQACRRPSVLQDEQAWTRGAVALLHHLAHTPLSPHRDDAAPETCAGTEGDALASSDGAPACHRGPWAALEQELRGIASLRASDADEVLNGRQDQQRRRLKRLLEEMEAALLDHSSTRR